MQSKKRSPIAAIVLAVVIGLLVIALLNGVIRPTQVVVAKVAIAPGTLLTDQLVELRTIPMGAKPADAIAKIEEVNGKMLAVGRAPGDLIVTSVLGEIAGAGIPAELPEGHVALAIHVDLASGVAGLLRPGQTVTVIGMISPDILKTSSTSVFTAPISEFTSPIVSLTPGVAVTPTSTPTPAPPVSPLARLAITGVRVLMVPQSFRYEEIPAGASEEELFSSARTSVSAQEGSVIVLDVPTGLVEVTPGFKVDPATLLAALDQYGIIHLALEPTSGLELDVADVITLNLGELYNEMNEYRKK
ncbi:MAG: RcpC/CpaB family pilus assembly protein [Chloroflexi bacterium]|nr:RcpC/CpaB family pilus assembly protein [Chloroflexota bacterium]